jgi:hypothetical protein
MSVDYDDTLGDALEEAVADMHEENSYIDDIVSGD